MSHQELFYQELLRHLPPRWFQQTRATRSGVVHDLLWAIAGELQNLQAVIAAAQRASIPVTSYGFWLSLHLLGIGLQRRAQETDAKAIARYINEFSPSRNTIAGLRRSLAVYDVAARIETDFAQQRFGELRVILDDIQIDWTQWRSDWVALLREHWISNGIWVGIHLNLPCLKIRPLPVFGFDTSFFHFRHAPFWESPAFADDPLRHPRSVHSFFAVTPTEWALHAPRLRQMHRDFEAVGRWVYLASQCPYYELGIGRQATLVYPPHEFPPFRVDGFDFYDVFPREGGQWRWGTGEEEDSINIQGNFPWVFQFEDALFGQGLAAAAWWYYPAQDNVQRTTVTELVAIPDVLTLPFLDAPKAMLRQGQFAPLMGRSPVWDFCEPFGNHRYWFYYACEGTVQFYSVIDELPAAWQWLPNVRAGLSHRWVTEFLEVQIDPADIVLTFDQPMVGAWEAEIETANGTELLPLDAGYWTDPTGTARWPSPPLAESVWYLVLEFLLPQGSPKTITELRVKLNGEAIATERPLQFRVDQSENFALLLKTQISTTHVAEIAHEFSL